MKLFYRIIIALYITFFPCLQVIRAQEQAFSSSTHYAKRMETFLKEGKLPTGKVIMFGDSHMEYGGDWNRFFHTDHLIINRGIVGDDAIGMYHRLSMIIKAKPRAVFFSCGTNDLSHNLPIDKVFCNIVKTIERLHNGSPHTQIFVCSLFPLCPSKGVWKLLSGKEKMIKELNKKLEQYCFQHRYTFIDLYKKLLLSINSEYMNPIFSIDGLHLSKEGYNVWVDEIKKYIVTK